jgi:hypothetical protein
MNRPKDRASAAGLLPRMEARPWRDGKTTTYRYHAINGKPINLGTDRAEALRKVLDMLGQADDSGTIGRLWKQHQDSPAWRDLQPRTQDDYRTYAVPLLRVFGDMHASSITPPDVARYLRQERADAPIRANREIALLAILIGLAVERGEATTNPARGKQVKRNKERPRTEAPSAAEIAALVGYAKTAQQRVLVMAAEFAALVGSRQAELLPLTWPYFGADEVRLDRAKQHKGTKKVERIAVSPALLALRGRLLDVAHDSTIGTVFPTRKGNPYTSSGFASQWQKFIVAALADGVIARRFTFHDLRAHYATEHQEQTGTLPNLHASPTTTAKIYERSGHAKRKAL